VQLQSSGCGVHLVARVRQRVRRVDLPTPSITRRLRCLHRHRQPCNLVGRTWLPSASVWQLRASWRLLYPTARAGGAVSLLETDVPHRSPLAAARLQVVAHRSLLATGSLLAESLLPPESTWVAHLQAASLPARPTSANPATSRSRGPSHRSRTQTLRPGRQEECRRWSRKLEEIVILNHIS
jgi:hypothetical protein